MDIYMMYINVNYYLEKKKKLVNLIKSFLRAQDTGLRGFQLNFHQSEVN